MHIGMKSELESAERGPDRNSVDFRIKKAQVGVLETPFLDLNNQLFSVQHNRNLFKSKWCGCNICTVYVLVLVNQ